MPAWDAFRLATEIERRVDRVLGNASPKFFRFSDGSRKTVASLMRVLSPKWERPDHLRPYTELLDALPEKPVHACVHAPSQHGKTEATMHGMVGWCFNRPGLIHAYATYSYERAQEVEDKFVRLSFEAGLEPRKRKGLVTLKGGTEIKFVGVGTGLTGRPVNGVAVIDDPIKDREDAESPRRRAIVWGWFTDVLEHRRHPGSSVVATMTRWHVLDLVGMLLREYKWPYVRLPAICDSEDDLLGRSIGEALWPSKRPLSWLQRLTRNAYSFAAMCQGEPRLRDATLFHGGPTYFKELPKVFRTGYGVDLAYSKHSRADWSVCVRGHQSARNIYVRSVLRRQVDAPTFASLLRAQWNEARGPMLWLASGTEKGSAQFIEQKLPRIFRVRPAVAGKYARATPAADDWNEGRILVPDPDAFPDSVEWVNDLVDELSMFTGRDGDPDDQVDALAALHQLFSRSKGAMAMAGASRWF